MTPELLIKEASKVRPDLMSKIAMAISMMDPEFQKDTMEEFNAITGYTIEKVATPWGDWSLRVGGALASALVGSVATDLYDSAKRGLSKSKNFQNIMAMNPHLKERDSALLKKTFDTMHKYAPEFTSDPNLGGQILNRMVELPHDQVNMMKELINARNGIRSTRKAQFSINPVEVEPEAASVVDARRHNQQMDLKAFETMLRNESEIAKERRMEQSDRKPGEPGKAMGSKY